MTLARIVHDQVQQQGGEIVPLPEAPGGLEAWARKAQLAFDIAKALALTPFAPESLRVKGVADGKSVLDIEATTGNVLGVLLAGDELGLQPMAALRSIDIIQGVPAMRAISQRALVQAAGHEIVVEESSSTVCVVKGRRKGTKEWQRSRWDLDRAKDLGLLGKENWRKQKTAMLLARASAECCRIVASDALLGMPYAAEELDDDLGGVAGGADQDAAPARGKRTAQRGSAKAAAHPAATEQGGGEPPEPSFDESPDPSQAHGSSNGAAGPDAEAVPPSADAPEPAAPPPTDTATPQQLKKLHVVLGANELAKRETGLKWISEFIGREITSSKDLSKAETARAIDELERRIAAREQQTSPAEPSFDEVPLPPEPPEEN